MQTFTTTRTLAAIEHRKADGTLIASYAYTLSGTGQRTKVIETTPALTRSRIDPLALLPQAAGLAAGLEDCQALR